MVFLGVMYACESWTIRKLNYKKAEQWRTDAFNGGVGEDSVSPLDNKEIQPVHPKGN